MFHLDIKKDNNFKPSCRLKGVGIARIVMKQLKSNLKQTNFVE